MKLRFKIWMLSLLILVAGIELPIHSSLAVDGSTEVSPKSFTDESEAFKNAISQNIMRVPEFEFIRKEAERLGVRAWLFGGTAAGFGHYVNWDQKRQAGDPRYNPLRFDYDYTNIYRSNQDLDIVVDGPPEKAGELQQRLMEVFPHFQGSKSAWEVRLLRDSIGDKQALLDNPDFLNQHTDSNSTGMIEVTQPPKGDPVIRDLRDWNSKSPFFLRDILQGKLHYYFSEDHSSTLFYKEGRNPPIISVIRYLTKAFQYHLELRPEDLARIKKIIDQFDPHGPEMSNHYVRHWLLGKDNGRKLIQNAVNIEYAWNTLEDLGLREKLIAIVGDSHNIDSLAWWMSKEPLRSDTLGKGDGQTAAQLASSGRLPKDLIVAHETVNHLAYESITRAPTGEPNVLISRLDKSGEMAAHGDGFYTKMGRTGAKGTNFTIRFKMNPEARQGTDFDIYHGDYVVIHNKNAISVIPESLNWTHAEFMHFLAWGGQVDVSDKALLEKLRRRVATKSELLSSAELEAMEKDITDALAAGKTPQAAIVEFLSYPKAREHSAALINTLLTSIPRWGTESVYSEISLVLARFVFKARTPGWSSAMQIAFSKMDAGQLYSIFLEMSSSGPYPEMRELLNSILFYSRNVRSGNFSGHVMSRAWLKSSIGEYLLKPETATWDDEVIAFLEHEKSFPDWESSGALKVMMAQSRFQNDKLVNFLQTKISKLDYAHRMMAKKDFAPFFKAAGRYRSKPRRCFAMIIEALKPTK